MDDQDAGAQRNAEELACRPPCQDDLVKLCRELNQRGALYLIIGGFAIMAAGLPRTTGDIDLLVAADAENEAKVYSALSTLPDNAVRELARGELQTHKIIRVGDEVLVDGVRIPFASPRLLWRMKAVTHRDKDAGDLFFLREWFSQQGQKPPSV